MPRPQPADLCAELNPRQQIYLTVIYHADQNAEANHKGDAFDWGHGPPASEWRWQTFSIKAPKEVAGRTAIQYALAQQDEHELVPGIRDLQGLRGGRPLLVPGPGVHVDDGRDHSRIVSCPTCSRRRWET
ncbi:hypothetical protein ABZY36_38105 [Streptomyces sp. NPDC006627]|uniref:hypothetical protein n=1 Tax=Streptomyces sp. NPDC006627 TaxID=3154679 RepID=UPI0033B50C3A